MSNDAGLDTLLTWGGETQTLAFFNLSEAEAQARIAVGTAEWAVEEAVAVPADTYKNALGWMGDGEQWYLDELLRLQRQAAENQTIIIENDVSAVELTILDRIEDVWSVVSTPADWLWNTVTGTTENAAKLANFALEPVIKATIPLMVTLATGILEASWAGVRDFFFEEEV